jgi:hypothetical protein
MQYVHILNLIDAYLDRLTEARRVLLTLDGPSKRTQQRRSQTPAATKTLKAAGREKPAAPMLEVRPPRRKKATPATIPKQTESKLALVSSVKTPDAIPEASLVVGLLLAETRQSGTEQKPLEPIANIRRVKAVTRRERTTRRKAIDTPLTRALGGTVSTAPVFIPAAQIRQERIEAETKRVDPGASAADVVPLTAELLTQRWVQGLVS